MRTGRVLGLDVGIGSVGWALYDPVAQSGQEAIVALGSFCFSLPEDKEGNSTIKIRGGFRRGRRRTRRRRWRLVETRKLCHALGLISSAEPSGRNPKGKENARPDPWALRAAGLERRLAPAEWAAVVAHLAKRRGYFANRKSDRGANVPKENQRMLSGMSKLTDGLEGRTLGQMLGTDPAFQGPHGRKRNREGDYGRTVRREDVISEAKALFAAQRRHGSAAADESVEERFFKVVFHQFEPKSSLNKVGLCRFEKGERRAPRQSYSFEKFRFLSRLNTVRIRRADRRIGFLTPDERQSAYSLFAGQKEITWKSLRGAMKLGDEERFAALNYAAKDKKTGKLVDPEKRTFARCDGTVAVREALGESLFQDLSRHRAEVLDIIGEAVIFHETFEEIKAALRINPMPEDVSAAVLKAVEKGEFSHFKGAGHISAKAARSLIPHLEAGLVYSEACAKAKYNHAAFDQERLEDVRNPVVRRVLREATKQVNAIVRRWGEPAQIHVELARDVGKSFDERKKIDKAMDERTSERRRHRSELAELVGRPTERINDEELLRYELWKEQKSRCIYTDVSVEPPDLLDGGRAQVDHILPISRSQDDSYLNKVLCTVTANQDKGNHTPWEWLQGDAEAWREFVARVESLDIKGRKKRNLLDTTFAEREKEHVQRHLNDTRYAARLIRAAMEERFPAPPERRRIFVRPGGITATMRRAWGLQRAKFKVDGSHSGDDRNHAVDALVLATTSEAVLQDVTQWHQRMEREGRTRSIPDVKPPRPWTDKETLANDVLRARDDILVARLEERRMSGALHGGTLYGWKQRNGKEIQYERKAVWELDEKDLDRLKDGERAKGLREALSIWLADAEAQANESNADGSGKKKKATESLKRKLFDSQPPRMPTPNKGALGPAIRRVRLVRHTTAGIKIPRGDGNCAHADNAAIVRVDVFAKGGKFHLVPIYTHQVGGDSPPNMAIKAHTPETGWPQIGADFEFCFSLYSHTYFEAITSNGEIVEGYYRSIDRTDGKIGYSLAHRHASEDQERLSTKTLKSFRKCFIDRFGGKRPVEKETRLWHGKACT